jgi:ABC-2 type transport system ATP-binding protein
MSGSSSAPAIEAIGLVKEFERGRRTLWQRLRREPDLRERFRAVDGVDLHVERGEIFGLLGPNGAGKTTTQRMLATLLEPTAGTARVLGLDVVRDAREVRRRMGAVLSDGRSLYWKLTARENLEYFAALYHVPPAVARPRIASVLETVRLEDRADDYVERFSTGMRQRLVLARALLPDPELLLLDEPTVGLDPQSARDLRDRVIALRDQGRTVVLTTHYMEEADQLCDRIAIIDHGRIAALDTPAALKRTIGATETVRLELAAPLATSAAHDNGETNGHLASLLAWLSGQGTIAHQERSNGTLALTIHCKSARDFVPAAFDAARREGATINHVEVVPVSLEDVFLSLTGRALRE